MKEEKNLKEVQSDRLVNKKGVKTTLIVVTIILAICVVILGILAILNKRKIDKQVAEKDSSLDEIVLENKDIEYGTEINVSDLNEPEGTIIKIDGEEVQDTYKFMKVGDIEVTAEKDYTIKNIFNKEQTEKLEKTATYKVTDTKKPVLEGVSDKEITVGDTIDLKEGITAKDEVDGDLEVIIDGTVDTNTVGEYKVIAKAIDKNGNETTQEFTVKVNEKASEETITDDSGIVQNQGSSVSNNSQGKAPGTTSNSTKRNSATTSNNRVASNNNTQKQTNSNTQTRTNNNTSNNKPANTAKKYRGASGQYDSDTPYWCFDGGSHHYGITLNQYEHGWYNSYNAAWSACDNYMRNNHNTNYTNFKIETCNYCGKYYFYVGPAKY